MSAPATASEWSEANQRLLAAELECLKQRLSSERNTDAAQSVVAQARAAMPATSALDQLSASFQLSAFETDLILLCAGVEMDAAIAARCAEIHGDSRKPYASLGLALSRLRTPHWSALTPLRPPRRWRLLELEEGVGLTQARLRIDERILHYLAGVNYLDPRLQSLLRVHPCPDVMAENHRTLCSAAVAALQQAADNSPAVMLAGDDASGHADIAAQTAAALGRSLHALAVEDVPMNHSEREALVVLCAREAELLGTALLLQIGTEPLPKVAARFIDQVGCLVFVSARDAVRTERPMLLFRANKPDAQQQKQLWQHALGPAGVAMNGAIDAVASQFRLSAGTIRSQGAGLRESLVTSDNPGSLLWSACRGLGRPSLDELAQRIEPSATWNDLILAPEQAATLRHMATHVRQRLKVYNEWGFAAKGSRGLGIGALFAGESGTGKTMAAEVLANDLDLDLYRIDLSAVVSKYIGETEKNLRRVFDAAEDCGAILLFDEADALFGKRSEVKDSHDRYANIEVSYLLQRMELYRGLAILTTNLRTALDTAFQRRLRFVVQFPFPDQDLREAIWRGAFPEAAPVQALDFVKLARMQAAGGSIRNIAINASFLAAGAGEPITMAHVLQAAHHEAGKRERPLSDSETRGWV